MNIEFHNVIKCLHKKDATTLPAPLFSCKLLNTKDGCNLLTCAWMCRCTFTTMRTYKLSIAIKWLHWIVLFWWHKMLYLFISFVFTPGFGKNFSLNFTLNGFYHLLDKSIKNQSICAHYWIKQIFKMKIDSDIEWKTHTKCGSEQMKIKKTKYIFIYRNRMKNNEKKAIINGMHRVWQYPSIESMPHDIIFNKLQNTNRLWQ